MDIVVIGYRFLYIDDRAEDIRFVVLSVVHCFYCLIDRYDIRRARYKRSHSWIVLGPVHLQPAEFAKYGTALALAKMLDDYDFDLKKPGCFFKACALILLPVVFILMQQETGSALVYLALICILYREGMSSLFLFAALCAIVYFVLAVKFASVEWLATPVGEWLVLTLILWVLAYMVSAYLRNSRFFYISLLADFGFRRYRVDCFVLFP